MTDGYEFPALSAGRQRPVVDLLACMGPIRRYRARFTPRAGLQTLAADAKCVYGVSVGMPNKAIADIIDAYRWATKRFDIGAILLGDGLYRITARIRFGCDEQEASKLAHKLGDDILTEFVQALGHEMPQVIRSSELSIAPEFRDALEHVMELYHTNTLFHDSVGHDARTFIERQIDRKRIAVPLDVAIDRATHYLLEEIAVYLLLAERGWLVDAYYGEEVPTLAKIITGEIPDAPKALTRRVNVAIRRR